MPLISLLLMQLFPPCMGTPGELLCCLAAIAASAGASSATETSSFLVSASSTTSSSTFTSTTSTLWRSVGAPQEPLAASMLAGMVIGAFVLLLGLICACKGLRSTWKHAEASVRSAVALEDCKEEGGPPPLKRAWALPMSPKSVKAMPVDRGRGTRALESTGASKTHLQSNAHVDIEWSNAARRRDDLPAGTRGEILAYAICSRLAESGGLSLEDHLDGKQSDASHLGNELGSCADTATAMVLRQAAAEAQVTPRPSTVLSTQMLVSPTPSDVPTLLPDARSGALSNPSPKTSVVGGSPPRALRSVPPETRGALLVCKFLENNEAGQARLPALPPLPTLAPGEASFAPAPPDIQAVPSLVVEDVQTGS